MTRHDFIGALGASCADGFVRVGARARRLGVADDLDAGDGAFLR